MPNTTTDHPVQVSCTCPARPQVRKELAPWEAQMQEVQGRIDVATSERDLLVRRGEEAKVRGEGRLAFPWLLS